LPKLFLVYFDFTFYVSGIIIIIIIILLYFIYVTNARNYKFYLGITQMT
jgi:hypothetical protein